MAAFYLPRYAQTILAAAEQAADGGAGLSEVLAILRQLGLDDFGAVMFSLPIADYPALSALLPPMATPEVQLKWTGAEGDLLLSQSVTFVRQAIGLYAASSGWLGGKTVLDFGCGYGRFIRLMYWITDPQNVVGVDAWDRSLAHCRDAKLPSTFAKIEPVASDLGIDRTFDFMFAFSVATHLDPIALSAALAAMRRAINPGGLLVLTVRPYEFWYWHGQRHGRSEQGARLADQHLRDGHAFLQGDPGLHYGDASYEPDFFRALPDWRVVGVDRSTGDSLQLLIALQPA